jgi:hypothetical protein
MVESARFSMIRYARFTSGLRLLAGRTVAWLSSGDDHLLWRLRELENL